MNGRGFVRVDVRVAVAGEVLRRRCDTGLGQAAADGGHVFRNFFWDFTNTR